MKILVYGQPGVGKTESLSTLFDVAKDNKVAVFDTEHGAEKLLINKPGNARVFLTDEYSAWLKALKKCKEDKPDIVVLDTFDGLVQMIKLEVMRSEGAQSIADIPYGKGYQLVKDRFLAQIKKLDLLCKFQIFIGHALLDDAGVTRPSVGFLVGHQLAKDVSAEVEAISHVIAYTNGEKFLTQPEPKFIAKSRFRKMVGLWEPEEFYKMLVAVYPQYKQLIKNYD